MLTKTPRKLLQKLNGYFTKTLETAAGFAVGRGHYEVTVEHLLVKLLEDGRGDLPRLLDQHDVDTGAFWKALLGRLEEMNTGNAGRPTFSPQLLEMIETGWVVASVHHGAGEVRSGHLLEALLESDRLQLDEAFEALMSVSPKEVRQQLDEGIDGSEEERPGSSPALGPSGAVTPEEDGAETALGLYTTDLTAKAQGGRIDPIFGRDTEIRQIIDILSRRRKNNAILVGEAGVGKTAVVEGLALRIARGDVTDRLTGVAIRTLDMGLLQAGAGVKGEFENRLKSVIQQVKEAPRPILLFIDEAHTLIGAGGSAGTGDAANLLKPALARGELRTIAATTWSEYKQHIEKDPALERRFQRVKIDEPSAEEAAVMLRGIKANYEAHHDVIITDEAAVAMAELSGRFVAGRQLPDKAVDLMDTAAARVRMTQAARPAALDDVERRLEILAIEAEALKRDLRTGLRHDEKALSTLEEEQETLEEERERLQARWDREKELADRLARLRAQAARQGKASAGEDVAPAGKTVASQKAAGSGAEETPGRLNKNGMVEEDDAETAEAPSSDQVENGRSEEHAPSDGSVDLEEIRALQADLTELRSDEVPLVHPEVNEQMVAQVVADWTGIPVGNMIKDEAEMLLELEGHMHGHIRGQDEALEQVASALRATRAGMRDPNGPLAVFLFVGPSGIGKTETARALADLLFGGERFLTTINMSEYQESHTVSQLKGSPPGYVGYGEGGVLTEAVRQRPYSVVLLDEAEKAHLDAMEMFYQVFDKGFMRDGEGREVDFRNTVLIMTSNVGSDLFLDICDEEERPHPDQLRQVVHPLLVDQFQPALLGRMRVVPFYPLRRAAMQEITRIKLGEVGRRLAETHGIDFTYDEEVAERIAERCTQEDSGARNVDFIIDRSVLPRASRALLGRMATGRMPDRLSLDVGEDGELAYAFDGEPIAAEEVPSAEEPAERAVSTVDEE